MAKTSRSEARKRPGSPRARLFLALDPPAGARTQLAGWRDALVAGRDDLRAVPETSLHVTLVFLGYRFEKEIETIAQTAFAAVEGLSQARLTPAGVRALPPRAPRLFALDLDDEDGRCAAIQSAAESALASARLHRPERRAFWPHVTLARVKRGRRAAPLAADAEPPPSFDAADVVLYRSLLSPQGARYEPLARMAVGAAS